MKKLSVKKESNTEFLARQMAEGFGEMKTSFEAVDKRFDFVDVRLEEMNTDITSLQKGQSETHRRLETIERKQTGMLESMDETVHQSEFRKLVQRVEVLEK